MAANDSFSSVSINRRTYDSIHTMLNIADLMSDDYMALRTESDVVEFGQFVLAGIMELPPDTPIQELWATALIAYRLAKGEYHD